MPNIKSAKKRLRSSARRREINAPVQTRVRSARRSFLESLETGDEQARDGAYRQFCSSLDKAGKCGVLKRNTVIRGKSRAAARMRQAAAAE